MGGRSVENLIEKKMKQNLHRNFFQVIFFFFLGIERRKKKEET